MTEYIFQFKVPIVGSDSEDGKLNTKTFNIKNAKSTMTQANATAFINAWNIAYNMGQSNNSYGKVSKAILRKRVVTDLLID